MVEKLNIAEISRTMRDNLSSIEGQVTTSRTTAINAVFDTFGKLLNIYQYKIELNEKILEFIHKEYPDSKEKVIKKVKQIEEEAKKPQNENQS